jgi:CoA:oxalate CoA-transferase
LPYGKPGSLKLPNTPIRLSKTPARVGRPMPGHGEHTDEILREWLGWSDERVAEYRQAGIIR